MWLTSVRVSVCPCEQVVREGSRRVLGLRPFDVQLIGGMILHEGQIAEMRTGEGKTLVGAGPPQGLGPPAQRCGANRGVDDSQGMRGAYAGAYAGAGGMATRDAIHPC